MLDLAIRDTEIIDGTGAARRHGDVGIRGGRIVSLGTVDEGASRTISAEGAVIAPGFVDIHTHYDAQVLWEPTLTPSCLHGVTTVVGGNCGFSVAPLSPESADYVMRMLARVEGMPLSSLKAGVSWDWRSTEEYLARIEGTVAVNVGFLVGHSSIRRVVMGDAATERQATAPELASMRELLQRGLAAGGMGFSSSLAQSHSDAAGDPVPSRHGSHDELLELAKVCAAFPGTSLELVPFTGAPFPADITRLMIELSVRSRRPLNWNIMNVRADNVAEVEAKLAIGNQARQVGGKVVGLFMPQPIEIRLNFASGFLLDMLPGWRKPMALPPAEKLSLLGSEAQRIALQQSASQPGPMTHWADWGRFLIYECFSPETKHYEGERVEDIAQREQKDPFDVLLDLVVADGLQTTFGPPVAHESAADWDARGKVLRDHRAVVGASDAGAHLDMIGTFNYTTMLLANAVRTYGLLSLEEAVHLLTEVPAALYGLRDRGVLREGSWADLVVFEEGTIGSGPLYTRHDLPGGAGRLFADGTGIQYVVVNGEPIVEHGTRTDRRPGSLLRSGRDTTTPSLR